MQAIEPGDSGSYAINVQSLGGFSQTVTLLTASPSPSLTLSLAPSLLTPTGVATLAFTSTHAAPVQPGWWVTLPITATGGGMTQTASVRLLVGGWRLFLPGVVR